MAKRKKFVPVVQFVKKGARCPSGMIKVQHTAKMKKKGMDKRIDFCATPDVAKRKGFKRLKR